ncbi:hypothetical protein QL285_020624 [Trifolium repens]|nr:hypothetical protein QL285_020624 [Trifolium repens]
MGCAQRPNRRDYQDFSVVGLRNRHLVLIPVMSCAALRGEAVELIWNVPYLIGTRGNCGCIVGPSRELEGRWGEAPSCVCRAGALSSLRRADSGLGQL